MSDDVGSTTAGSGANPAEQGGVWREIGPNEVLPVGHVRMNVTTGRSEVLAPGEAEASSLDRGEGHTPAQDTADTTNSDANERESGSAETVQAAGPAPLNDALKTPAAQSSQQRGKKRRAPAAKAGSAKAKGGAVAASVDAAEREASIKRLTELADDVEYDAQVAQEARRIGVKVATIGKRRTAYQKANAHQVDAAEVQAAITRMLDLPPAAYAIELKREAQALGIPTSEFRKLVETERNRLRAEAEAKAREAAGFGLSNEPPPGAKPKRKPDANGVFWPFGFTMKEDGLWYQPPPSTRNPEPGPIWVCAPFEVVAETSDDTDHEHGLLLRWKSRRRHPHVWALPQAMVHAEGNAIAAELQGTGLSCGTSHAAHDQLKHFLGAVGSARHARCVDRSGWHDTAFVLPNGDVVGASPDSIVLQSEQVLRGGCFTARGTLAEWKEHIAALAVGNSRLVFGISDSLAPPLYELTDDPSCGVHSHGPSQIGKTTVTCIAASPWGPGNTKSGQIRSWRGTANGMEAVAAQHNDLFLALDEIGQGESREVGAVVYMLHNQRGKMRMSRGVRAQREKTFRLGYFSTGEVTLAAKMGEVGLRTHAGQEVRLLNVPADAGAGLGVFEDLHGAASAGEFADQLRRDAVTYYGTAGPAFLEKLVEARTKDSEKLKRVLRGMCEQFLAEHLPKDADGQVRSAALRFALIAAAGELARAYGVVPWPEGEATQAAAACFKAWLAARGSQGTAEDQEAIDVLRLFISKHGASRFEDLDRKAPEQTQDPYAIYPDPMGGGGSRQLFEQKIVDRAGYVRKYGDSREFLILASVWRDEIFKGMDAALAAKALKKAKFLVPGKQSTSTTEWIPGTGSVRVYVIKSAILG
jgi:uncharacterized protein (DUF927 family)